LRLVFFFFSVSALFFKIQRLLETLVRNTCVEALVCIRYRHLCVNVKDICV